MDNLSVLDKMKDLYGSLGELHQKYYNHLVEITESVKGGELSKSDSVDVGFLCRESENLLDDLRKDCKARREFIGKKLAMQITRDSLTNLDISTTIRGTLARGDTDVKKRAKLPKKGTPEYKDLLKHFDVPTRVIESEVLSLSWNKIGDLVSECAEDGKPMPPGIGETYTEFTTTYVKNR